jgi:hypothetical protein
MYQKHKMKIGCSAIVQVERLDGVDQKIEQSGVGFFFFERSVKNLGNEQGYAIFYWIERNALKLAIYLYVRYPLHLPVGPMMQVGFNQMQRLKHGRTRR